MKKNILFCLFSLAVVCGPSLNVHAWSVPETGQVLCYDNASVITCPPPGEPFYGQDANYSIGSRAFTKLDASGNDLPDGAPSWAMVRDNVLGLIWECKTDDGTIHDKDNQYGPEDAQSVHISALNSAVFGGFDDWRLPTIKELSYIVDRGRIEPAVDPFYFPYITLYYWTSTPDPSATYGPYYVQTQTGYEYNFIKEGDGVMGVRGEITVMDNGFVDNGDGTVTDTATGLMWQQSFPVQTMGWQQALAYCESLVLAGHDDWRLPNVNELQSIVDYTQYGPSIDTAFFPDTPADFFWTSTSVPGKYSNKAWPVHFDLGWVDFYFGSIKTVVHYVRAVRGPETNLIALSSLDAVPQSGSVIITWETSSEVDNTGFNLYRADSEDGEYICINEELIPAEGSPTEGTEYEFVDDNVQNRKIYYYKLEDIDVNGGKTIHGPVNVMPRFINVGG